MYDCTSCGWPLVTTQHATIVCSQCGIVSKSQLLTHITPRDWLTDPLMNIYSRKKRFRNLVDSLFWPTPSAKENKMLAYLTPLAPFPTKTQLLVALKNSRLSDKRYSSMHFFCRTFVQNYDAPTPIQHRSRTMTQLLHRFCDIEFVFMRLFPKIQFFNYAWLLSQLLLELHLNDYVPFVKTLKCKQRLPSSTPLFPALPHLLPFTLRLRPFK